MLTIVLIAVTALCTAVAVNRKAQLERGYSNLSRFQRSITPLIGVVETAAAFGGWAAGIVFAFGLYQEGTGLFLSSLAAVGVCLGTMLIGGVFGMFAATSR